MYGKLTNDVHNALIKISQNEYGLVSEMLINKLHLMGLIMPELHNKWLITIDGKAYLDAVEYQNPKK